VAIVNGAGRFLAIVLVVYLLGGLAAGAMAGALIGIFAALLLAMLPSRTGWSGARLPFDWKGWLGRVIPLTLGLGASQFIFSVDMILVRSLFGGEAETGHYVAAGTIGRGLVMFTAPLTVVMFPKIVHSISIGSKTHVLAYTLYATALLGSLGALGATGMAVGLREVVQAPEAFAGFLPAAVLNKLLADPAGVVTICKLIPWFVWCMLPLALANVLLNNLMAARHFRVVPALIIVAAAYASAVVMWGKSLVAVIQILGVFNLIFFAVLYLYTSFTPAPGRGAGRDGVAAG
jgi:O-antigen/teichoic acid export membrane protein